MARKTPFKKRLASKMHVDMKKFSAGTLHSGSGKHVVTSRKQAMAIAYSQARKGRKK